MGASASRGDNIRSSRSNNKEDRSNGGNRGNSSNHEGGHGGKKPLLSSLHDADGADNDDYGVDN